MSCILQMGSETYHHLKRLIQAKYGLNAANVGDEGGFSPPLSNFEDALDLLVSAIKVRRPDDLIMAFSEYVPKCIPCERTFATRTCYGRCRAEPNS